jgi:purine-binding chemotaxis protein CheW
MNRASGFDWQSARERLQRARLAIESEARSPEQLEALYAQRAAVLAQPPAQTSDAGEAIMVFHLGAERYAIPLTRIAEVVARPRIAPAPGTLPVIAGLIQIRGEIRVTWNLRRLLGLSESDSGEGATVLLLRTTTGEAGLLVDDVEDIRTVVQSRRRPAPDGAPHAAWSTEDLVIVLDTETLLPRAAEENANP